MKLQTLEKAIQRSQPDAEIRQGYQTINSHIQYGLAQDRRVRITFTYNTRTKKTSTLRFFRSERFAQNDMDRKIMNQRKVR